MKDVSKYFLELNHSLRRGTALFSPGHALGLSPVGEVDSTGSILDASDLSFDNTQGSVLGPGVEDSMLR